MRIPKYKLTARELMVMPESKIWEIKRPGVVDLTFDDGVVKKNVNTVDVIISWYYWQIANAFREIKISSDLFLDNRVLTDSIHRDLMFAAIMPTIDTDIDKEDVWRMAYRDIYNKLFNAIVDRLTAFVTSTDVPHILEILFDSEVFEANQSVTDNPATIDRAYETVTRVLKDKYPKNPICRAMRYKTVKLAQLLQSFGPRGLTTDIDSNIYQRPIKRGFAMGFRTINDICKESRSAAKAYLFNKDPVADAEYFNRKLQLVCGVLRRIVKGDCGATELHEITIPEGKMGKQFLGSMAGLYRQNEEGELEVIRESDEHLLGKVVKLRTTMTCLHLPKQCVCETCYGESTYSVAYDSNPGHVSCTAINERITQLIISTKHLDFIQHLFKAWLTLSEKTYMSIKPKSPDNIYLNPDLKGKNVAIRFKRKCAENLSTVNYCTSVQNLIPGNMSVITNVEFCLVDKYGIESNYEDYDMTKDAAKASLSLATLAYIKKKSWSTCGDSYIIVFEDDWDINAPIFTYPKKHDSMAEFADRCEQFIRSSNSLKSDGKGRGKRKTDARLHALKWYTDQTAALVDCYLLISEKLPDVHFGHVATILATSRAQDPSTGNYNMPAGLGKGCFASHNSIIAGRSGACAALFEEQYAWFESMESFLHKNRHSSVLDNMIYIPQKNRVS